MSGVCASRLAWRQEERQLCSRSAPVAVAGRPTHMHSQRVPIPVILLMTLLWVVEPGRPACGRLTPAVLSNTGASVAQQDVLVEEVMNPKPVLLQEDMSIK